MNAGAERDETVDLASGAGDPALPGLVAAVLASSARVRFRASGASMAPAIRDGDAITVAPVAAGRLRRGEVVLARRGGGLVAHRLVRRLRRPDGALELLLRGDAASTDDPAVPEADVLGRVVEVDRGGLRTRPSSWPARGAARLRWWARRLRGRLLA